MEPDDDLDIKYGDQQQYLLHPRLDLASRLITTPIRRISRGHDAPISLERIQKYLIRQWMKGNNGNFALEDAVKKSKVFGHQVAVDEFPKSLEKALEGMGDWKWMRCPGCLTTYI